MVGRASVNPLADPIPLLVNGALVASTAAGGVRVLFFDHGFAQRVIGALLGRHLFVEIEALPGLDDGVDVEGVDMGNEVVGKFMSHDGGR